MPRGKSTGQGYADKGRSSAKSSGDVGQAVRGAGVEDLLTAPSSTESTLGALQGLMTYDEGWLRIVSHDMGSLVFFKFKFSKGRFAGSYVFFRCDDLDYRAALWGLLGKVQAVYAGDIRPTPDTPYD